MKRWYVVQVYAGYEEAVKADLEKRIRDENLGDLFGQILVPAAKVQKHFQEEQEPDQQLFPGYILVEFEAKPETMRMVTSTPRVNKFLGGREPSPLTQREVDRILAQVRGEVVVSAKKSTFEIGREIEITDGPFSGFIGIIDKIDDAAEKLSVMVSIFGRMTPVELGFNQVKR